MPHNKGTSLQKLGQYNEALESYENALKTNPWDPLALNNKAVCLQSLGQYPRALECIDKALQIRPQYPKAHKNEQHIIKQIEGGNEESQCCTKATHTELHEAWAKRKKQGYYSAPELVERLCNRVNAIYERIKDYTSDNAEIEDIAQHMAVLEVVLKRIPNCNGTSTGNVHQALEYLRDKLDAIGAKIEYSLGKATHRANEKSEDILLSSSFRIELGMAAWEIDVATSTLFFTLSVHRNQNASEKLDNLRCNLDIEQRKLDNNPQFRHSLAATVGFQDSENVEQPISVLGALTSLPDSFSFLLSSIESHSRVPKISFQTLYLENGEHPTSESLGKSLIGRGGFGFVCKAKMRSIGDVAFKLLNIDPGKLNGKQYVQFKRECVSQYQASVHPNVASLLGMVYDLEANVTGLVMDFARGGSLCSALNAEKHDHWNKLSTYSKLRSFSGILSAVNVMHSLGVIHAHLNPHNVLLANEMRDSTSEPFLWLIDSGLLQTRDSVRTSKGSSLARTVFCNEDGNMRRTGVFMAPETIGGTHVTKESDIYSLATTIGYALSCEELYCGADFSGLPEGYRTAAEEDPYLRKIRRNPPTEIVNLLQRAWNIDPLKRPTAAEFLDEWQTILCS